MSGLGTVLNPMTPFKLLTGKMGDNKPKGPAVSATPAQAAQSPNANTGKVDAAMERREFVRSRAKRASVALANEDVDVIGAASRKIGRTARNNPSKLGTLG